MFGTTAFISPLAGARTARPAKTPKAARTAHPVEFVIDGFDADPFSHVGRYLLENSPRTVLRGARSMAELLGAERVFLVAEPDLAPSLRAVCAEFGVILSAHRPHLPSHQAHLSSPRRPAAARRAPTSAMSAEALHRVSLGEQGRDPFEFDLITISSGALVDATPSQSRVVAMPSGMSVREILKALPEGFLAPECSPEHHVLLGGTGGTWVPALTDRPAEGRSIYVPADYFPVQVAMSQILHRAGHAGIAEAWDELADPRACTEARRVVSTASAGELDSLIRSALGLVAERTHGLSDGAYVPDRWQEAFYA